MRRIRPVAIRVVAKPLRRARKTGEARSKGRDGEAPLPADINYASLAERTMAFIMAYGSEKGRMVAAKYFLDRDEAMRKAEKKTPHIPVIQYVITGEPPPLGEGEYDTSIVEEGEVDGEAELRKRFGMS
ncbi:hypothetical protein ABAC460_22435 [Asticcacaulis sp. AC460]|uniref:hypothetical protein n=1 Tax=Asticcacaulis sp. AC460 TaxID=1282360 RepID=UPI0003C3D560|nr:hypothetical protein [Asticcacaulis sp. AC460]ESQ86687.1 hypothetical protein ABAC460_22435 [Asticcacaulis sp. AC460]